MEIADFIKLARAQTIAEEYHRLTCNYNHTDECGWYYEFHNGKADWNGGEHKRYLEKVLMYLTEYDELVSCLQRIEQIKKDIAK